MAEHDQVEWLEILDNEDDYLYVVHRVMGLPNVTVHLSDAYEYTRAEYLTRPDEVDRNSFVVLVPHAHGPTPDIIAAAKVDGVGVGKIGKLMGALRNRNVWEYESPEERADREKGR